MLVCGVVAAANVLLFLYRLPALSLDEGKTLRDKGERENVKVGKGKGGDV